MSVRAHGWKGTLMKIRSKLSLAALVVVFGTLSFTGCGATDGPAPEGHQSTSTQSPDSDTTPQTETEAGDATETSDAPEPSDSSQQSSGNKPSKADVREGFIGIAKQALGDEFPEDYADEVVQCAVDEFYDELSPQTLNAIADQRLWEMDTDDFSVYGPASQKCAEQYGP